VKLKLILSLILVLAVFLACYGDEIYLSVWPPHPGNIIHITVRSQLPFNFDQEKAFGSKRNIALAQYTPLYRYVPDGVESMKKRMQDLIQKVSTLMTHERKDGGEFEKYLRKEFGVQVGVGEVTRLLQYPNLKNLLEAVMSIEESILQSKIVEDPKPLKGKKTVEVLFQKQLVGPLAYAAAEVLTLGGARDILQQKLNQIFWQVDRSVLDPVVQIAVATVTPNLKYDEAENNRRIDEIIRKYPSNAVPYKAGEVLVPFRRVLSEEDVLLLTAHLEVAKKAMFGTAPWVLFVIFFILAAYDLLVTKVHQPWQRNKTPRLLHLSVLIIAVVLLKLVLLFTSSPIYALPIAFIPFLMILLYPERVGVTLSTLLAVLLVSLFTGRTFQILLFFGFGAVAAILATPVIKKRSQIVLPSLIVGCTNAVAAFFVVLDGNTIAGFLGEINTSGVHVIGETIDMDVFRQMGWAFAGGLVSGPIALLLLPLLERMWNTASTFELFKYADLDRPMMKDLLSKTPGTYQHTMSAAQLAQVASEAIGADTLLVRIGAYYHDIGKTDDPKHYVENQFGGPNPHDALPPEKSVRIITGHVKNGLRLGREEGLPEVILDFIQQHHGTQLLEYFYDKARRSNENGKVPEQDFRYWGPKPQRAETAILMIADAVEAASRSLQEPNRENIEAMVRQIIQTRVADGQFEECDLSTRDIARIRETLVESLTASFHTRVEYPWQKDAEGRKGEELASIPLDNLK
jgi:cyclic-di-AMP phosphodiesterase PgpH